MESLALMVATIMLGVTFANMVVGIVAAKFLKSIWAKFFAGLVLPIVSIFVFQNPVIAFFMIGGYIIAFTLTYLISKH